MMSGTMPSRIGMETNGEIGNAVPQEILNDAMGAVFRRAGYQTVYGGKTHLPGSGKKGPIESYGFDILTKDERDELAGACATFLRGKHERPFLLVASFINPHDICYMAINDFERAKTGKPKANAKAPHQVCLAAALERPAGVSEAEFFAKYCPPAPANLEPQADAPEAVQQSLGGKAKTFRQHAFQNWSVEQWRLHRWAYCRLTERVDREIGQVLRALRAAGLEEKTVVLLTSDHGDMDGSHRLEHKSMFYEEATRVPFIVSFKGATKPGLVDNQHLVSSGLDLIPTLCDFAGIQPPAGLLGRSVRALAEGRSAQEWRPHVVSETHYGRMICSGRYKYCVYETGQRREQLVDLEKDPGEMKNLAADPAYADVLSRHRQYLREWVEANHDKLATPYLIK
jgi:choline-sulfatase